jgi:alpha-L-rhamnosidase
MATLRATKLRTEYLNTPLGIDIVKPRFSWIVEDERRGTRQSAYQVLVATDPSKLKPGKTDAWDSGVVKSSDTAHVEYAGQPLKESTRYYWAVQAWDGDGKSSGWTKPTWFEMGIQPSSWKAKWIGRKESAGTGGTVSLDGVKWIWHDKTATTSSGPAGVRHFSRRFELPNKPVKSAFLYVAADNLYQAALNGKHLVAGGGWEAFQKTEITKTVKAGKNLLSMIANNTDGPAALGVILTVEYADGTTTRVVSDGAWKSNNSSRKTWTDADLDDSDWPGAHVVASAGDAPWGKPGLPSIGGPAALLRKTVDLSKPIASARVYVTALGTYRLNINGKRVGNDIMSPDWTDYRVRTSYQTYDVTKHLKSGANVIGAMLGDGWYASGIGWQLLRNAFGPPPPRFMAQIHVWFKDGSDTVITTDKSWTTAESPILRSEIYAGETYDARNEQPGWDSSPTFTGKGWANALEFTDHMPKISAQRSQPVQVTQTIEPIAITSPSEGVYVYDMGQNMVGLVRLKVPGAAGRQIKLRFAEILQPNGQIYTENLRAAEVTDYYTCKGDKEEIYEPYFTFHGFRFVEITGFPGKPGMDAITGVVFHTDAPLTGRLETSSKLVNQIWKNAQWGQRGNMVSVPTDCPQRDERLGWMGDANIFWPTASYNMDMSAFSWKWIQDVIEAQSKEGGFSDVSPRIIADRDGAPGWADAGVSVPYYTYRQYGDKRLLEHCWPHMEAYLDLLLKHNPNHLWLNRRNNDYGDWVPANSETPKDLIGTAFWAYDAKMMAEMARALGKTADAKKYDELFAKIRDAFNARYVNSDGTIGNGSQTCYVLALHIGLLPENKRAGATAKLIENINQRGGHLSTGFIGTAYLMLVLGNTGQTETAYRLALSELYPSWGYMVFKGATTIWERWNGDTGDPAMNSYNHYAFGAVAEWMYKHLAGIDTEDGAPGFERIVIRPRVGSGVTWANGEYDSLRGTVKSGWKKTDAGLEMNVTIPANTTATIYVPASSADQVTEGGKPARNADGVKFVRMDAGNAVFMVGSGSYAFKAN